MDRGYTNLLLLLRKTNPSLPLTTIQNALAHYLAHLSPLPTPLSASAVSSPFYLAQPFTSDKLQSLLTAFRHAAHLRYRKKTEDLNNSSLLGNLFSRSLNAVLIQWIGDVVKGIQGGHPVLRLSSLSGLLLGIHDLEREVKEHADESHTHALHLSSAKHTVEDELVVAVAQVIDTYPHELASTSHGDWEKEFEPVNRDILILALVISAQSLPLVSQSRFDVLPLSTLNHLLVTTLSSTLRGGRILHDLPTSCIKYGEQGVAIPPGSPAAITIHAVSTSPVMSSAASVSRLAARTLRSLLEGYSDSKKSRGLASALETLQVLRDIAMQVELGWSQGPLVDLAEQDIEPNTLPITQGIWTSLKTLLFATVMLSDAILASVIYIKPDSTPFSQAATSSSELSHQVLQILSHFAFLISQFGGVTSTSQGFEYLKKTFYLALDILAQENTGSSGSQVSGNLATSYVKEQCLSLKSSVITGAPSSIRNAKRALVLASIEQLVPVLDEACIRDNVFDVCWPHLSDPSHRETFESAHSVILAIFKSHAESRQHQSDATASPLMNYIVDKEKSNLSIDATPLRNSERPNFAKKVVPFYAHCLIENSADGRLSTPQLRMAYAALVQCAAASRLNTEDALEEEASSFAWYCVQLLLDTIHFGNHKSTDERGKENISSPDAGMTKDRLHRLHLTLISAVPSLPLVLMLRVLREIKIIITSLPLSSSESISVSSTASTSTATRDLSFGGQPGAIRGELVKALYDEIVGQVGFREKSAAMRWWYDNRMDLQGAELPVSTNDKVDGRGVGRMVSML